MKNTTLDLLKSRLFDFTIKPPAQNKILTIDDNLILSRGNFAVISGLPKVGKSSILSVLIAAALSDNTIFNIKINRPPEKNIIALFDTEQSQNDLYNTIDRSFNLIQNYCNASKAQLYYKLKSQINVFSNREDDPENIILMIETYLQNNKSTGLIVIDGLLDLVLNYNDEKEGKILINFLKKITKIYDVGIIVILHTGKTTGSSIGHVGSFADRYCQSNLEVTNENETIILKSKLVRSSAHIQPIAIIKNGNNLEQIDYITNEKRK